MDVWLLDLNHTFSKQCSLGRTVLFFNWSKLTLFGQFCWDKPVEAALLLLLCFQGSSASWFYVSSSSTCKRWSQWEIVPASRWSSLLQSEYRDCFPVGPSKNNGGKILGSNHPLIHFHTFWVRGGWPINHFSVDSRSRLLKGWNTAGL